MVDPDEALNLLFEDNAGRPDDLRAAFSELCRQPRIDEPLRSIDAGVAWVLYKIAGELTDPAADRHFRRCRSDQTRRGDRRVDSR